MQVRGATYTRSSQAIHQKLHQPGDFQAMALVVLWLFQQDPVDPVGEYPRDMPSRSLVEKFVDLAIKFV